MNRLSRALLSFIVLSAGCWAQSTGEANQSRVKDAEQPVRLRLTPVETILAPAEVATGFAELVCDGDGNLYLGSDSPDDAIIRKLSPKGELVTLYQPNANPDIKVSPAGSFTVTQGGDLYLVVGVPAALTRYVLVFKADGSYKSNIKLQPGFAWMPASIAVFANGTLLMTGQRESRDPIKPAPPFTGIFSPDGRLLKETNLEDDQTIHEMATSHDPRVVSATVPTSNHAVSWGQMKAAQDGNIYVMRWLSPAIIYAVSPGGEVVRRFTVDPGSPAYMPIQMHISGGRIAVLFYQSQTNEKIMKVMDLEGHELATYDDLRADGKPRADTLNGAFVCYSLKPERFTFLATDDNHRIQLKLVEGR